MVEYAVTFKGWCRPDATRSCGDIGKRLVEKQNVHSEKSRL